MIPTPAALRFAEALTEKFHTPERPCIFVATGGVHFDRIVCQSRGGLHAFVGRATGMVFKPCGRRPAPGPRYETVELAAAAADPYGSYLYADIAPGIARRRA